MQKRSFLVIVLLLSLFVYKTSPALAKDEDRSGEGRTRFSLFNKRPNASESPRVRELDRLDDKRLKFCQNHEEEINTRVTNLGRLVSEMLGKFDGVLQKVQTFYTEKLVPEGKMVSNYDSLVADIATKKTAVTTALANAQADVVEFSCTGDNPKGQITEYRTDMQAVKQALQDYRASIKTLITAVRAVAGETKK